MAPARVDRSLATESPRGILVRGVNWLGDAVMTIPALIRIRERWPSAEISLLTHDKIADLWLHHPAVNNVVTFSSGENVWGVSRRIRTHYATGDRARCDLALVLPNSPRSALVIRLAGIPRRIGYARPWRSWMLTQAIPARPGHVSMRKRSAAEVRRLVAERTVQSPNESAQNPSVHQMHDYLHLAAAIDADPRPVAPTIEIAPSETAAVAHQFGLQREHFEHARPLLGLNPGALYGPAKRWPGDRFISAAAEIQHVTRCRWLIFGSGADRESAEEISQGIKTLLAERTHFGAEFVPPLNLAGQTSLRQLAALLKICRAVLTNDSGPMHLAAAVGTPVVVPFGSTSSELTGPGLPGDTRHKLLRNPVPCAPCFRRTCPIDLRCLTGIECRAAVEAVLAAAGNR
jgi:heptosyltransferase-2